MEGRERPNDKTRLSESTLSLLDHGDGRRRFLSPAQAAAPPSEASFSRIAVTTSRPMSGRNSLTVLNGQKQRDPVRRTHGKTSVSEID